MVPALLVVVDLSSPGLKCLHPFLGRTTRPRKIVPQQQVDEVPEGKPKFSSSPATLRKPRVLVQWLEYDVKARRHSPTRNSVLVLILLTGFQRRTTTQDQGKTEEGTVRGRS